jgi:hypothetical protein
MTCVEKEGQVGIRTWWRIKGRTDEGRREREREQEREGESERGEGVRNVLMPEVVNI